MSYPNFQESQNLKELQQVLKELQEKYDTSNSCLHKPILKSRIDRIKNILKEDLYNKITTDFEFIFNGEHVRVITDYEKFDKNMKCVQLVKINEPRKSFGQYSKDEIIKLLKED